MKWAVVLSVAIAACSAGVTQDLAEGHKDRGRYFYFPGDGDGILHLVDTHAPVDEDFLSSLSRTTNNNAYWLYTRENPTQAQILERDNLDSVVRSNFDFNTDTVFIAHGWFGNGSNEMNELLTEAFLVNDDVNVIVLDWSRLSGRNYITARNGVPLVGRRLGQFINWLASLELSYNNVHLVGFCFGAHLMGNAGRESGGLVRRITALDPAGPLWGGPLERIQHGDAQYVEVIHTNTRLYGYIDALGDADHFPNGGASQPYCLLDSCSHSRAYELMAASVKYNHILARKCLSYNDAKRNTCNNGYLFPMGNSDLNKQQSGIFRANTGSDYPYKSLERDAYKSTFSLKN